MKRLLAISSLVCIGLATGCKSAPEPEPEPKPEPPSAEVVWSVPLTWQSDVPMVAAQVRDAQTKFIVSTSSSNHTLTKSFASAVRAPVSTSRQTTKVHGVSAEVERVEGVVSVSAADADWRLEKVVAAQAEALDPQGIGGFIAPQQLTSNTEHVVLDFRGGAMTLVSGNPDLFGAWFDGKYGESTTVALQRDDQGLIYVDAVVDGSKQKLQLDTGIARTRLSQQVAGAEIANEACVERADLMVECLPGVDATIDSIEFAGSSVGPVQAVAVSATPPTAAGSLGTDVLKNCTVGIGVGNQAYVVCN